KPRHRTRRPAMGELALDHLCHAALLKHDESASGHFGHGPAVEVDEFGRLEAERAEIDAILIDGGAVSLHLLHKSNEWAAESDDVGELAPAKHSRAHLEEVLCGGVGVGGVEGVDLEPLADDEERMRKCTEQRLSLDLQRLGTATKPGPFGRAAQEVYPLVAFIVVRPRYAQSLCKQPV